MPTNWAYIGPIDEAKVARLMEVIAANIEEEVKGGYLDKNMQPVPKGKPDWKLQHKLEKELTLPEVAEVDRRKRLRAKECWRRGERYEKYLWGGW
jgi:hypothetical protein